MAASATHITTRKGAQPVPQFEKITPKIATAILNGNTHNRTLSDTTVRKYAAEMKAGQWNEHVGDAISIAEDGSLNNGQHRLWAIVESGCTITMLVVRGADKSVFKDTDAGRKRTPGDNLHVAGVKNANVIASMASNILAISKRGYGLTSPHAAAMIPRNDAHRFAIDNDAALQNSVSKVGGCGKVLVLTQAAALHYLFSTKSKHKERAELADAFFRQLATGAYDARITSATKHPVYVLREKLYANRNSVSKLPTPAIIGMVIKAWNSYVQEKAIGLLRVTADESFPTVG